MEAINVEELRRRARRRLPRAFFDFVDGGALDEVTLAANRRDFDALAFLPKTLIGVATRRQQVRVLGQDFAAPLILAPTGLTGLFGPGGEGAAARAAKAAGVGYCLSTMASTSIEALAEQHPGFWFQLYIQRDRGVTQDLVERAAAAGCPVLCVTVDTVVQGQRERDLRNGFTVPPRFSLKTALDFLAHPAWLWRMTRGPGVTFANFAAAEGPRRNLTTTARQIADQFDPAITWQDIGWLRSIWAGKLAIKGILTAEDARHARDQGADAVIVSNHGGRQLDGATTSIAALPGIAEAVGDEIELLLDSGVRRGSDVVKALALGARACLVGRAFLYGLAADGENGVASTLAILRREIDTVQALIGCPELERLDRSFIALPGDDWPANR